MSTLKVINVIHPSGSTNNIVADSSGNVTFGGTAAMASSYLRNRIINGDMRIDQRNAGASVSTSSGTTAYSVDRFLFIYDATGKFTIQQNAGSVTPPSGFSNYLGVTSSSAYSSTASQAFLLSQNIEGYNVADLAWGTASAQTVTLSFWVRSSLTGTHAGCLENGSTRSYVFTYTVSSANTWEYKTITVAGDTNTSWSTDASTTNGVGMRVRFNLGSGSNFIGTANAWNAGDKFTATGAQSIVGTNGATFYITGVQLEVGSVATPFERRQYGQELALCQRYYYRLTAQGVYTRYGIGGVAGSSTSGQANVVNPVSMRVNPTAIEYSNVAFYDLSAVSSATLTIDTTAGGNNMTHVAVSTSGMTAYRPAFIIANNTTSSYFAATAEL